jgi:hypothetical protein
MGDDWTLLSLSPILISCRKEHAMQTYRLMWGVVLMIAVVAWMGWDIPQAWAQRARVPQTGQTECYSSTGVIPCVGTGQDGKFQAGVAWPTPRFSNRGDGTVRDNLTGLIWLRVANCFGALQWAQALMTANMLAQGQCGLTDKSRPGDWRLPNVNELRSIVAVDFIQPALSDAAGTAQWTEGNVFSGVQVNVYWSSTTLATHPDVALFVHFEFGHTGHDSKEFGLTPYFVWPVRGGD